MSYFIFNDINSVDLGLMITKPVIRPTWGEDTVETKIPGVSRIFRKGTGVYPDIHFTINTALMDASPNNVRTIYKTLCGSGILLISTAPDEYLNVEIEPLVPEAVALLAAEIPIGITAHPFANSIEPTITDITEAIYISDAEQHAIIIENSGSVYSDPVIEYLPFIGENDNLTDFNINAKHFAVRTPAEIISAGGTGYKIVIDSEHRICYFVRPSGEKVSCTQCTYGSFPRLETGLNALLHTNHFSFGTINVKERWL